MGQTSPSQHVLLNKLPYQVLCYPETIPHATIPSWAYRDANSMTQSYNNNNPARRAEASSYTKGINKKHLWFKQHNMAWPEEYNNIERYDQTGHGKKVPFRRGKQYYDANMGRATIDP